MPPPALTGGRQRGSVPLNAERHGRQVKRLPPEAKCVGSVHAGGRLVHRRQRLIEREGVWFLYGRKILEGRRPLRRSTLRAVHHMMWSMYHSQYEFEVWSARSSGSVRRLKIFGILSLVNGSAQSCSVPWQRCSMNTTFQTVEAQS